MDNVGNFNQSFGAPYYRSADYRIRYPAYLRRVVPPPLMPTMDIMNVLQPKQYGVRKTAAAAMPRKSGKRVMDGGVDTVKTTKAKRKSVRIRRQRLQTFAPLNGDSCNTQAAADDGVLPAEINNNNNCAEDAVVTTTVPLAPTAVATAVIDEDYTREDASRHLSPPATNKSATTDTAPVPVTLFTVTAEHQRLPRVIPQPTLRPPRPPPPPPPPPQSPPTIPQESRPQTPRESDDHHDDYFDPVERLKRTAKLFERECARQRRSVAENEARAKAKAIAEQAREVTMAAKRGDRSADSYYDAGARSGRRYKTSEYAELERLGLGKHDSEGRWIPHSKNKFKERLINFR